jgi:hypothetical protein
MALWPLLKNIPSTAKVWTLTAQNSVKGAILLRAWGSYRSSIRPSRVRPEANADVAVPASLQSSAACFSFYHFWSYPDVAWVNLTGPGLPRGLRETSVWLTDEPEESA